MPPGLVSRKSSSATASKVPSLIGGYLRRFPKGGEVSVKSKMDGASPLIPSRQLPRFRRGMVQYPPEFLDRLADAVHGDRVRRKPRQRLLEDLDEVTEFLDLPAEVIVVVE